MIRRTLIVVLAVAMIGMVALFVLTRRPEWQGGWSWTSPLFAGNNVSVDHQGFAIYHNHIHPGQVPDPEKAKYAALADEVVKNMRETGELTPSPPTFVDSFARGGFLGLRWGGREVVLIDDGLRATRSFVCIPLWMLLLVLAAYPTVAFVRGPLRHLRRRKHGLCVKCGYDLRGNVSDICPECGTPIPPASLPPSEPHD